MTAALNVHAHLPYVAPEGRYRLGKDLTGAFDDLWINTTWDDGTHIVAEEPIGWEGLEFLTPIDQAGGRDGGLTGPPSVAPRTLEINGLIISPDPATLRRNIASLRRRLGPRKVVVWDQYDPGTALRMGLVCRVVGAFRATPIWGGAPGGIAAPFSLSLVAANPPWKFGTGAPLSQCAGLPVSAVSGRTYNKTYSWNYGATTNPGGYLNAANIGDIDAWPVITVTGAVDSPIITNESTGDTFTIVGTIPSGETVTIDTRSGVVTPSNYRLVGRPFALQPGMNTVRWRATSGSYTPDAQMCFTWRPTWE